MSTYFKYLILSIILQLIFSELITINGYQANLMILFVILSSMPIKNTSQSTLNGFLIGIFTDFVLFSGVYAGTSSLVFSVCGLNPVTKDCVRLIIERISPFDLSITLINAPGVSFAPCFFKIF